MAANERNHKFDVFKGILIFFVVLGHALIRLQRDSMNVAANMIAVIFSFHMPAFVFISGFFSKSTFKSNNSDKIAKQLLIPFLVSNLVMWFLSSRRLSELFSPGWTLWYLLALIIWRQSVCVFSKLRCSVLFSVVLALLIGFTKADRFFSISRIVSFFPFFLLGYKTDIRQINHLTEIKKSIAIVLLLLGILSVIVFQTKGIPLGTIFQMADSYGSIKEISLFQNVVFRLYSILLGCILTFSLLILLPSKKKSISYLGRNTFPIYLGHSYIIVLFEMTLTKLFPLLFCNEVFVISISISLSIVICLVLGNRRVISLCNMMIEKASGWLTAS